MDVNCLFKWVEKRFLGFSIEDCGSFMCVKGSLVFFRELIMFFIFCFVFFDDFIFGELYSYFFDVLLIVLELVFKLYDIYIVKLYFDFLV